jgi:hypothetical protein
VARRMKGWSLEEEETVVGIVNTREEGKRTADIEGGLDLSLAFFFPGRQLAHVEIRHTRGADVTMCFQE